MKEDNSDGCPAFFYKSLWKISILLQDILALILHSHLLKS